MSRNWEPRAEKRRTRDGEGARWDVLRDEVLERDEFTCKRCGYEQPQRGEPERRLEAHYTLAHGTPSLEDAERLVTLCGPCHATLHADDPAYGDLRKEAPMFPQPEAPASVATMRSERQHVCQRCQHVAESARELAAYTENGSPYVLCKPCAGALLDAGYDPDAFEVAGDIDVETLEERADEAPVRPVMLASGPVRAARPPRTAFERVVYDTPLRYLLNPIGFTLLFIVLGVAASFYLF
ncbi:MAG: hypothetical protein ACI8UR_001509 [Natronomonas sp.]|jgi:hypothetical protein|uniref:HNH endonuclease n=1 Tax=Natronomonas sp. TaxID=2184060 RepID=UPI003989DB07